MQRGTPPTARFRELRLPGCRGQDQYPEAYAMINSTALDILLPFLRMPEATRLLHCRRAGGDLSAMMAGGQDGRPQF